MLSSTSVTTGVVRFFPEYDGPVNLRLEELRALRVGFSGGMVAAPDEDS